MKYTVLLQKEKDNSGFTATAPILPGCQTKGATEQEALDNIRARIEETLSRTRVVSVEVEVPEAEGRKHSWETFAGMWKDDPSFDEFLSEIETERQKVDVEGETA